MDVNQFHVAQRGGSSFSLGLFGALGFGVVWLNTGTTDCASLSPPGGRDPGYLQLSLVLSVERFDHIYVDDCAPPRSLWHRNSQNSKRTKRTFDQQSTKYYVDNQSSSAVKYVHSDTPYIRYSTGRWHPLLLMRCHPPNRILEHHLPIRYCTT
jgi:hypothetical protein